MMKKFLFLILLMFLSFDKVYGLENFEGFTIDYNISENTKLISGEKMVEKDKAENTYFKLANIGDKYTIGYCADGNKATFPDDGVANMKKNCQVISNNSKILNYVFENGYSYDFYNKTYDATDYLTGDYEKDYYITQSVMWYYTKHGSWMSKYDFENGTYDGYTNDIIKKISKLAVDAKKAEEGGSFDIVLDNTNMSLTEDETYYVSSPIKLNGKYLNSKVNVSVSGVDGAFVTDDILSTSGNNSFDNGSTIYIKVAKDKISKSSSITLNAETTTAINESQIVSCERVGYDHAQPVMVYLPKNSVLNDSVTVNVDFTPSKHSVKISKVDIVKSEEIPGATLYIRQGETVIKEWVSKDTPEMFYLDAGTYTLEEVIAPDGYELSDSVIEFTIDKDGSVLIDGTPVKDKIIVFKNTPIPENVPTGDIVIYTVCGLGALAIGIVLYIISKKGKISFN